MTKEKPAWLQEARAFCRGAGIKILAWGPDMLTVEAKSQDRATEVASHLGQLGFKTIENEDDASAGMLSLSRNPAAVQARVASFDVSRRRWDEQIEPLIWVLCSLLLVARAETWRYPYWLTLPLGALSLVMFFWSGSNIWGWRLEILPEGLRVRRRFRWTTIPWGQIKTVESIATGRSQGRVVLALVSHSSEQLGTFNDAFARNMRDRLRNEIAQRRQPAEEQRADR